jgi:1,4-alpha-glucan branching enzyme
MSPLTRAEAQALAAVAAGVSGDPFAVLGRHPAPAGGAPGAIIRTLQPAASAVDVIVDSQLIPMERRSADGLFEAFVPWSGVLSDLGYRLRLHEGAESRELDDPYQFGPILTDFDLHLFA